MICILVLPSIFFSQNITKTIILDNYKTINAQNSKNINDKTLMQKDLFYKDVTFDNEQRIYLSDAISKKILVFNRNGKFDSEINLNNDVNNIDFTQIKICSYKDNLYVLLLNGEFYVKLVKYIKGKMVQNFELENPSPIDRNINVTANNDKIFVTIAPSALDPRYYEKGLVFVYSTDGDFLGRTDYFYEDENGRIYKSTGDKNNYYIQIFEAPKTKKILMTKDLKKIDEIAIPYIQSGKISNQDRWYYVGHDEQNNIYVSNNYKVLKYNSYTKLKKEIYFDANNIRNNDLFITNNTKIRCDFTGKLFLLELKIDHKNEQNFNTIILQID